MNTPQQRLEYFIDNIGIKNSDVAKMLQMTTSNFHKYIGEKGRSVLGKKFIKILNNELNLNPSWYLLGDGQMLVVNPQAPSINNHHGVPFYPIDITASIVRSFDDIPEEPEFYIDYKPFNDCSAYFPVYGDSMYPLFNSGDVVAVKRLQNFNIILWGEPHFVITDETANNLKTVKLLFPNEEDKNSIILRASNPNFRGDTIIDKEAILNIFIVKGKISQRML